MLVVRRRTRVVGAFPHGESVVMLVSVRPRQVVSTRCGTRKYMTIAWLKHQGMEA